MVDSCVQYVLHSEAKLTTSFQEIFQPVESWLVGLCEFLSPSSIDNYVIPMLGSTDMQLMGELTFLIGMLNVLSSVIKWTFPQSRPYWWIREYDHKLIKIHQTPLTCDTTAGFPSNHSVAYTGLVYILLLHHAEQLSPRSRYLIVTLLSIPIWIARVYFGSHFLHQCICGSFVAVFVIETIKRRRGERAGVIFMETWRKTIAITAVAMVGLFVIGIYFAMLAVGLDPHWSVRMAFKWCIDPQYLRHESSPVFVMCRDLGFMMGVALSTPLTDKVHQILAPKKSIPAVVVIMAINFCIRKETPKNYGRFVFVAYEFLRNAMNSFSLLTILPKLCVDR